MFQIFSRNFKWLSAMSLAWTVGPAAARAETSTPERVPGATADFSGVTLGGEMPDGDPSRAQLKALIDGTDGLSGMPGIVLVQRDSEDFARLHDVLVTKGYLATVVRDLHQRIKIPGNLRIVVGDCGEVNATYIPSERAIAICHEVIAYYADNFRALYPKDPERVGIATVSATTFSLLHELGHAFFDIFGLPNLGSEEDAADRIAALLLLEQGDPAIVQVMEGARGLQALGKLGAATWDVHAFGDQRFYNVACLVLGSTQRSDAILNGEDEFNEGRAPGCVREYDRARASLDLFLAPYRPALAAAPTPAPQPEPPPAMRPVLLPLPELLPPAPQLKPLPQLRPLPRGATPPAPR
jgi:hypothetical protein